MLRPNGYGLNVARCLGPIFPDKIATLLFARFQLQIIKIPTETLRLSLKGKGILWHETLCSPEYQQRIDLSLIYIFFIFGSTGASESFCAI